LEDPDRQIRENVERFGCSVMHIAAEDDLPPFAFSVGIEQTSKAPEVVVIGLKKDLAHFVVNEYHKRAREGEIFKPGALYQGFIGGFDVMIEEVEETFYEEYFGYNLWYYDGPSFRVLQIVYPNTDGIWPWQPEASEWFRSWQPVLSRRTPTSGA
jgi:hypothetical protein